LSLGLLGLPLFFFLSGGSERGLHIIMLAVHGGMSTDEIGNLPFAHPKFSEAIKETSRMVQDNAIHFIQKSRRS